MVTDFNSDYVEARAGGWGLGLKPRLMAAGWFAGAACVPVIFVFLLLVVIISNPGGDFSLSIAIRFLWMFAAIPISAAALLGFIFGCRIVDPFDPTTAWRAALRGSLVAFFSYVLFIVAYGMSAIVSNDSSRPLSEAIGSMAMVFVLGFVFVGWLVLIVGALAGWLLYLVSSKEPGRFLGAPGETVETANLWIAIAILLFLSNCAGFVILGKRGYN